MGIASLIMGIIALFITLVPFLGECALYPAIPGIILGIISIAQKIKVRQSCRIGVVGIAFSLFAVCSSIRYHIEYEINRATIEAYEDIHSEDVANDDI